jgi:Pentapeptide repeats (8 copies)
VISQLAGWWHSHRRAILAVGAIVAALLVVAAFIWPITDLIAAHDVGQIAGPRRTAELQAAREAVRTQLLTLAAGVFVAGALWFTAQNYRLSRQGQVTDRYTKAMEQLGSDKLDVRIGAIYALERIARDSATDHPTVMEVLAAFIREHSREQWPPSSNDGPETEPARTTRPDVQAAVTVIGRRDIRGDRQPIDLSRANLSRANLGSADLHGADLSGADLDHTNLGDAKLAGAKLSATLFIGANLAGADLTSAELFDASLARAFLKHANLTDANLTGADLTGADLFGADLTSAYLVSADLSDADLDRSNLQGANLADAKWREDVSAPAGWVRDPASGLLRRPNLVADEAGN